MYDTVERIKSWKINDNGWYYCPEEDRSIKISDNVKIGNRVTIGDGTSLAAGVIIDDMVTIGEYVTLSVGVIIGHGSKIESGTVIGARTKIGTRTKIKEWVEIGANVNIGKYIVINEGAVIADHVKLSDGVILDEFVSLGIGVKLEDGVKISAGLNFNAGVSLGKGETSLNLAQYFRDLWKLRGETVIFTKWVTHNRMSPNFDGGTPIHYPIGEVIEVDNCIANDKLFVKGLYVLERGHRPEWYGLCYADHKYIPLDVEVNTDDILFGGLPSMTGMYRVRKLRVLN